MVLNQYKDPSKVQFRAYDLKRMEMNKFAFIFADY